MRPEVEHHDIVIVGGGICGLATALGLHRKGINALVLEKSKTLRAEGAAIGVYVNGWRALDQLGVGAELRMKAIRISEKRDEWLHKSRTQVTPCRNEELSCLKRSDLIEKLADTLPVDSIRFGSQIVAVEADPVSSFPNVHIDDGNIIKAKVLIGCDGSNSVVAKSLGLGSPDLFPLCGVRGFTGYPNGHMYGDYFLRLRGDGVTFGRIPVNDKLVYWFVARTSSPKDSEVQRNPKLIRDTTLELLNEFPLDVTEMVKHCDISSLSFTHIRYRAPWHLLSRNLWKGTTTVAGDAMHVMGPFLGQGGSAGLEDAVVLARCLAQELHRESQGKITDQELQIRVTNALRGYVKERKLRLMRLSIQTYLMGVTFTSSLWIKKLICVAALIVFFGGTSLSHTQYDCGRL